MSDISSPLQPAVVLGIAPHPDDLDVGAGGTLAAYSAQGAAIHYLILTDGGKGSDDASLSSTDLVAIRQTEQQRALEIVGGGSITFLDYPDGELEVTLQLKKQIVTAIRQLKPDVVITLDPTFIYDVKKGMINHPDHRAAGQATLDAVFPLARDHLTFPDLNVEGITAHKVPTVLMINFQATNFGVDISQTFQTKLNAIRAHTSQFSNSDQLSWVRTMAQEQGELYGHDLSEGFVRIDLQT
ncbi:PIG-L family deacetylase [Candidatus Saccharibacteria bacterium]|nr:PIG-L family deacetylase [Candidatus Saccharibacteria bacterium]